MKNLVKKLSRKFLRCECKYIKNKNIHFCCVCAILRFLCRASPSSNYDITAPDNIFWTGSQISHQRIHDSRDSEDSEDCSFESCLFLLRQEWRRKSRASTKERERSNKGSGVANLKSRSASEQRNVLSPSSVSLYDHIRDDTAPPLATKLIWPWIVIRLHHMLSKKSTGRESIVSGATWETERKDNHWNDDRQKGTHLHQPTSTAPAFIRE